MGGKKPLRRPLWPPTRATASNYYPLGLDGAGGAAKPLLRAPKKPAPLHGRLPAFSGAVDAFERARKCFLEWRYFFSIILSEFLKNRVALQKVSSFFLFCSGLENVSDTPVAYQSRSAACVEITLSSFYHKSKNIELPLGWLDIFFLSIFCVSVLFRGGAFSFSAAGISRRTGIGGVRRGQTEENDCRGMLASTKNLSAISRYHKNLAMSRINLQDSCYN